MAEHRPTPFAVDSGDQPPNVQVALRFIDLHNVPHHGRPIRDRQWYHREQGGLEAECNATLPCPVELD